MNGRSTLFLAIGIILAGITGWLVYEQADRAAPATIPQPAGAIDIVVAKADIPARTVIVVDLVERRSIPGDLVPPGAIRSVGEALGQTTLAAIPAGVPLVRTQLAAVEGRTGASVALTKGKVLVAFPTSDPLTAVGLVTVGDRVDLLATITSGTGESAKKTQTTIQDLEVVEVIRPTKEQPSRATALTFVVDHQVALVLKYLRDAQATVDIAVRSTAEREAARTTSVDLGYLIETFGIRR